MLCDRNFLDPKAFCKCFATETSGNPKAFLQMCAYYFGRQTCVLLHFTNRISQKRFFDVNKLFYYFISQTKLCKRSFYDVEPFYDFISQTKFREKFDGKPFVLLHPTNEISQRLLFDEQLFITAFHKKNSAEKLLD